ncbi:NIF domain-containing protein [Paracoccidioides lutzii Pb01]|uniref:NIF domain-containing protein n=1 Tax=Paracoccidioides lutzii (strain ATCC MYA-826 / Pb01) TaxID=502779 RepID=C1GPE5_PARBA|nr:NIF domain-containing protein [Paracoccidioides lutzii Pb01]EEH36067.1 NIF domain-containing protein [Paracoccidioides lutzii Pb01]
MNSLNILSSHVIGQPAPSNPRPRSRSQGPVLSGSHRSVLPSARSYSVGKLHDPELYSNQTKGEFIDDAQGNEKFPDPPGAADEKTPLLQELQRGDILPSSNKLQLIAQRLFDAIAETLKIILSALATPGIYVARAFKEDGGSYSLLAPARRLGRHTTSQNKDTTASQAMGVAASGRLSYPNTEKPLNGRGSSVRRLRSSTTRESISSNTSESEPDRRATRNPNDGDRASKSKSIRGSSVDEGIPRRSIRIKLNNEGNLKRKQQKERNTGPAQDTESLAAESLKSPMSASSHKFTKYPHAPSPPRPLIPPRQPSYTSPSNPRYGPQAQKTLVLDLDETLIHSLAKGGRMSSGHMVEVKLSTPVTTSTPGGPTTIGPQHPILYYVHKRPHCDDFLRKVCKWYKLVVFTASVQEYADPVIDWLEQERKFFHRRYYRQHCTFRNGAYIKDLSSVEPDLSKVMILDNSPMSYIFHEDNAIPIEGWINDPTDNDLLHLIPILEAMQYVTDVRALLALRRGEAET